MRKPLYVNISGGLGNQLFMFASSLSLSYQWSKQIILVDKWYNGAQRSDSLKPFRREFNLLEFPEVAKHFRVANRWEQKMISLIERFHFKYQCLIPSFGIRNIDDFEVGDFIKPATFLYGYMQEPARFINLRNEILLLLKLSTSNQAKVDDFHAVHRQTNKRLIAVHVRRGDYAHPDMFGCLLTSEYFQNALKKFDQDISKVLIFSDSPEWCKGDSFLSQFEIVDEDSAVVSMMMMKGCDDFIVSPSTFSWWAAWLGASDNKRVIAPKPYNEFDSEIWEQLVQVDWVREPAIFASCRKEV